MTVFGFPDWHDAAAYGDTTRWKDPRWRWEFTRRRDDYCKDFDKAMSEVNDPRRLNDPHRVRRGDKYAQKYGLVYMLNYRVSDQPVDWLQFGKRFGGVVIPRPRETVATMLIPQGVAGVQFDLAKPIDRQWADARKFLMAAQAKRPAAPRKHVGKWLTYLRVIDARVAGATWSDIARSGVLGNHVRASNTDGPQAARQIWLAARRLMFNWPN